MGGGGAEEGAASPGPISARAPTYLPTPCFNVAPVWQVSIFSPVHSNVHLTISLTSSFASLAPSHHHVSHLPVPSFHLSDEVFLRSGPILPTWDTRDPFPPHREAVPSSALAQITRYGRVGRPRACSTLTRVSRAFPRRGRSRPSSTALLTSYFLPSSREPSIWRCDSMVCSSLFSSLLS